MRSAKYIGLFAICGFLLSFVSGLFSHSSILSILLKALIFAIVFGLLGLGIYFIFTKFLSNGSNGDFQGEYTADSSSAPSAAPVVGQNVDITIQDEELAPSESENHFVVGDNHQMLNDSDVRNSANGNNDAANSSQGFVPLRNFETIKNFSGKEAVAPADAVASEKTSEGEKLDEVPESENVSAAEKSSGNNNSGNAGNAGNAIDTLPDMENFVFSENSGSESDDSDTGTDSDFVASSGSKKKTEAAEVQDAALMAKAISSVLSDEDS